MEREVAERFLDKFVGVVRLDNGRDFFSKGILARVTDTSIVLENDGSPEAISLDSIKNIRVLKNRGRGNG